MVDDLAKVAAQGLEALQGVAPVVWEQAIRQMYVNAGECFVVTAIAAIALPKLVRWIPELYEDEAWEGFGAFLVGVGCVGLAIAIIVCSINGVDLAVNPVYWAAMKILGRS